MEEKFATTDEEVCEYLTKNLAGKEDKKYFGSYLTPDMIPQTLKLFHDNKIKVRDDGAMVAVYDGTAPQELKSGLGKIAWKELSIAYAANLPDYIPAEEQFAELKKILPNIKLGEETALYKAITKDIMRSTPFTLRPGKNFSEDTEKDYVAAQEEYRYASFMEMIGGRHNG